MTQTALDIATASKPKLRRWLADQQRPCLRHGGTGWAGGPSCDQCVDGYVLAFPWAREPLCPHCGGACRPPPEGDSSPCEDCDDTGVLKAFGLEEVLAHAPSLGDFEDIIHTLIDEHIRVINEGGFPDYMLAALRAFAQAAMR